MDKKSSLRSLKDEFLEHQASDWAACVHLMTVVVVKTQEKYWGCKIPISENVEKVIEQNVLEMGIAIGRYDPVLKDYVEINLP